MKLFKNEFIHVTFMKMDKMLKFTTNLDWIIIKVNDQAW